MTVKEVTNRIMAETSNISSLPRTHAKVEEFIQELVDKRDKEIKRLKEEIESLTATKQKF